MQAVNEAPRFVAVESIGNDPNTGDPFIIFRADDKRLFKVTIAEPIMGAVVASLLGRVPPKAESELSHSHYQFLTLSSCRKALHERGEPALVLGLDAGIELPIAIPRNALAGLQSVLTEFVGPASEPRNQRKKPH